MTAPQCQMVVARSAAMAPRQTRRAGIRERVLLAREQCPHQNVVLVECDEGAEVEAHPFATSESFFVLEGTIEITTPDLVLELHKGDLCHLPGGMVHALRCPAGSAQILLIFAPPSEAKS